MTARICVFVLLGMLPLPVQAQNPPNIDVTRLGPQVGERIPDFRLIAPEGRIWTRDSIMGPNGAMLVFSRSADW